MKGETRICVECGKSFVAEYGSEKICSEECRKERKVWVRRTHFQKYRRQAIARGQSMEQYFSGDVKEMVCRKLPYSPVSLMTYEACDYRRQQAEEFKNQGMTKKYTECLGCTDWQNRKPIFTTLRRLHT